MSQQKKQPAQINWQDFNYPPLLKMIHFVPSEIIEHRLIIFSRFSIHLLLLLEGIINIVNNSIQTAEGAPGIRILYSFLFFIFVALDLIAFYRAYGGILKDKSMLGIYTYLEPILFGFWIAFAIGNFLGFNGFIKVSQLYSSKHGFTGTLSLIESLIFTICALISAYDYVKICRIKHELTAKLIDVVA